MDWKSLVGTVAPWIGTALGGPLGGAAIGAIGDALGLSDKTETTIKAALAGATPADMLAIKNADNDFALKMQELGYADTEKLAELAVDNTKNAREMQMNTKSMIPAILSILITVGFFGILIGMLSGKLTATDNQALLIMLGALGAAWGAVVNYYFGSSADSSHKTTLLAQANSIK